MNIFSRLCFGIHSAGNIWGQDWITRQDVSICYINLTTLRISAVRLSISMNSVSCKLGLTKQIICASFHAQNNAHKWRTWGQKSAPEQPWCARLILFPVQTHEVNIKYLTISTKQDLSKGLADLITLEVTQCPMLTNLPGWWGSAAHFYFNDVIFPKSRLLIAIVASSCDCVYPLTHTALSIKNETTTTKNPEHCFHSIHHPAH